VPRFSESLFLSGFPTKILYAFLMSHMRYVIRLSHPVSRRLRA
jgi:hypothetical protein